MSVYVREYIKACEAYGWNGGPEFSTTVIEMENKGEKRNAKWRYPRHFYSVPFMNIPITSYKYVKQMHLNRRGRWGAFLYNDRSDNYADNERFGTGDGTTDTFQLSKLSTVDGVDYSSAVYALYVPDESTLGAAVESDIVVTVNGTPTTAFTLNPHNGTVEFDSAPANGAALRWTGYFSRWVRFDQDRLPFSIDNLAGDQYLMNGNVDLIEVNPPSEAFGD